MVERLRRWHGIRDDGVLEACRPVPEAFVGDAVGEFAHEDTALPIEREAPVDRSEGDVSPRAAPPGASTRPGPGAFRSPTDRGR